MSVAIGDPIQVKVFVQSSLGAAEKWLPATVCYVTRNSIGAAFSDGERLALPNGQARWRTA